MRWPSWRVSALGSASTRAARAWAVARSSDEKIQPQPSPSGMSRYAVVASMRMRLRSLSISGSRSRARGLWREAATARSSVALPSTERLGSLARASISVARGRPLRASA